MVKRDDEAPLTDDAAVARVDAQLLRTGHGAKGAAVDRLYERRLQSWAHHAELPPVLEVLPSIEDRLTKSCERSVSMLDAAGGMALADWTDLQLFHEAGVHQADRMLAMLDDAPTRAVLDTASVLRSPFTLSPERVQEARFLAQIVDFVRLTDEVGRKRGYAYGPLLATQCGGIAMWIDDRGRRHIEPFAVAQGMARAS